MFFSKIFSFGPKKEELIYETQDYKMYSTTFEDKNATKFIYKNGVKQYSLLNNIHHENLISPLKINTKSNAIYTKPLLPFVKIYKSTTKEYNEHIFLCLAKSIDFLHTKCNILHSKIETDSLFFTEDGQFLLGGFEKARITDCYDSDNIQFSNLLQKHLNTVTNYTTYIQNNQASRYFLDNEIFFFGFDDYSIEQKKKYFKQAKSKKNEFIDLYKLRIIRIFIQDLSKDFEISYKYDVLNNIFSLDLETYDEVLIPLFNILDTNVRLFLFRNTSLYTKNIICLDKCLDSLLLGLKIKKNEIRKETIKFFKLNFEKFTENSKIKILESMYEYIIEPEDIILVLNLVNDTIPYFKSSDIVYRICKKYLTIPSVRIETLNTIQMFYSSFNKHKVSTELLPLICTYLADEKLQSSTFLLIESILKDLKRHKKKIISKEWSFSDFFQSKKNVKSKSVEEFKEKIKQEIKNTSDDEWDDEW